VGSSQDSPFIGSQLASRTRATPTPAGDPVLPVVPGPGAERVFLSLRSSEISSPPHVQESSRIWSTSANYSKTSSVGHILVIFHVDTVASLRNSVRTAGRIPRLFHPLSELFKAMPPIPFSTAAMKPLQALHAILWQNEATHLDKIFSEFELVDCDDPMVTPGTTHTVVKGITEAESTEDDKSPPSDCANNTADAAFGAYMVSESPLQMWCVSLRS
jgi:hypothetical protein